MTVPATVSQIEGWRPAVLGALADGWDALAGQLRTLTGELDRQDHAMWTGEAAATGWADLARIQTAATQLARRLVAGADAARRGCAEISGARDLLVHLVTTIRGSGLTVLDDGTVTANPPTLELTARTAELTAQVGIALDRVGTADRDAAADIAAAFGPRAAGDKPAGTGPAAADVVTGWPAMSQDRIAEQIAGLTPEQRRRLIEAAPLQVGNTDGVPWDMRFAANRINIADAIHAQRQLLSRPDEDKVRDAIAGGFGRGLGLGGVGISDPAGRERLWAMVHANPALRGAAIAFHDRIPQRYIDFYGGLLAKTSDPTHRSPAEIDRQILAFDPARSSLVELHGDLGAARSVGVLVPGLNTTVLGSAENTKTARRFVAAGRGDVAMITYLGGPFPTGDPLSGVVDAANPRYAEDMAPRLVAFSEDVNRTVDATGRFIPVTYVGHSYGGSILGTAEKLGLMADRTVYVEAAGAGVGVHDTTDWHNRNPDVQRYSMTAPRDPIAAIQGIPFSPHGADPDEMPGVWRLPTGRRLDGSEMSGLAAHGDVVNEPSDAWRNLLSVITGR